MDTLNLLEETTKAMHIALDYIARIQGALGTEEIGDALVEVARNAHKAEQRAAAAIDKMEALIDMYGIDEETFHFPDLLEILRGN